MLTWLHLQVSLIDLDLCENRSGNTIDYSWFVQTRDDVADFNVQVQPLQAESLQPDLRVDAALQKDVGYGLRNDIIEGIADPAHYAVCIRARDSLGYLRPWKPNQCHQVISNSATGISSLGHPCVYLTLCWIFSFIQSVTLLN